MNLWWETAVEIYFLIYFKLFNFRKLIVIVTSCHLIVSCVKRQGALWKIACPTCFRWWSCGNKRDILWIPSCEEIKHIATWREFIHEQYPPKTAWSIHVEGLHWLPCHTASFSYIWLENTWQLDSSCLINLTKVLTNPAIKLTMIITIHQLKQIQKKMIALKLHMSFHWNHQLCQFME